MSDYGAERFRGPKREAWGDISVTGDSGDGELTVCGYAYDDQPGHVEIHFTLGAFQTTVSVSKDDALALADDVETLAREIEGADP